VNLKERDGRAGRKEVLARTGAGDSTLSSNGALTRAVFASVTANGRASEAPMSAGIKRRRLAIAMHWKHGVVVE
jgi:hypothetical protein